jgi:hypothetical protein
VTIARSLLVDRTTSGYYHCYSRCVRKAYLCGAQEGGQHRKDWIRDRLMLLSGAFALDVGGYAILDNHFHTVIRTDPKRAVRWSSHQVVKRWFKVYPASVRRWALAIACAHPEKRPDHFDERTVIRLVAGDEERVGVLRIRLADLSWFMRALKEPIARRANIEDGVTGHFWEGRFKSLRILGPIALLATLIYVDLNVIRALLATTPESSDYTSAQDRILLRQLYDKLRGLRRRAPRRARFLLRKDQSGDPTARGATLRMSDPEDGTWLAPIDRRRHENGMLDVELDAYFVMLDHSGRMIRQDKRGAIPAGLPPILERLKIDVHRWRDILRDVGRLFGTVIGGTRAERAAEAARRGVKRVAGVIDPAN